MKNMYRNVLLFTVVLSICSIGIFSSEAQAQNTPCYVYTPTSPLYSSDGMTEVGLGGDKYIKIPNQRPPSILQSMVFPLTSEGAPCAMQYNYTSDRMTQSYLTNSGFVDSGFNFPLSPVGSFDPSYDPSIPGPLQYAVYSGVHEIGGTSNEDAVINNINTTRRFGMRIGNTNSYQNSTMGVLATNCVKLGGNGPRKIVFMRGKSLLGPSVADFLSQSKEIIDDGFKAIDPYKTYIDQFSFYLDLTKYDESNFPKVAFRGFTVYSLSGSESSDLKIGSSCTQKIGLADQYLFYVTDTYTYHSYAFMSEKIAFLNTLSLIMHSDKSLPIATIHEVGHSFAELYDEYITPDITGSLWLKAVNQNNSTKNCTSVPARDYRDPVSNKIYGSVLERGCTYLRSRDINHPIDYYKPSANSMMNGVDNADDRSKFNVISCGYIIAAIKGEEKTQKNASKYWAECTKLDTIKSGLPAVNVKPTVSYLSKSTDLTVAINTHEVSGSNFSTENNSVKLTYTAPLAFSKDFFNQVISYIKKDASLAQAVNVPVANVTTYEVTGIPSTDTTHLTFQVPPDVPVGKYKVSVGAFNSDWTNTNFIISVNEVTPPTSTTTLPQASTLTLTTMKVGSGTVSGGGIDCGDICAVQKTKDSKVTLLATPDSGWEFSGWSGACTGIGASCIVSMSAAKTVTANFISTHYSSKECLVYADYPTGYYNDTEPAAPKSKISIYTDSTQFDLSRSVGSVTLVGTKNYKAGTAKHKQYLSDGRGSTWLNETPNIIFKIPGYVPTGRYFVNMSFKVPGGATRYCYGKTPISIVKPGQELTTAKSLSVLATSIDELGNTVYGDDIELTEDNPINFGGLYGSYLGGTYINPITGYNSCPKSYTGTKMYGTNSVDYPFSMCHQDKTDSKTIYDFGGMYGRYSGGTYPNPTTGTMSCPSGYTSSRFKGMTNADFDAHFCYRNSVAGQRAQWEFGGMYGYGQNKNYPNPATGDMDCAPKFASVKIAGQTGVDFRAYYCYATTTLAKTVSEPNDVKIIVPTISPTYVPKNSATPSPVPSPYYSPTPSPIYSPIYTPTTTVYPSSTSIPAVTTSPSPSPSPTATPTYTSTPSYSPVSSPSSSISPSVSPTSINNGRSLVANLLDGIGQILDMVF